MKVLIMFLLLGLTTFSCTTTQKGSQFASSKKVTVIKQSGQEEAFWASQDRQEYVDLRKELKDGSLAKIYATLATGEWTLGEKEVRNFLKENPGHSGALRVLVYSLVLQKKYSLATYFLNKIDEQSSGDDLNLRGLIALSDDSVGNTARFSKARNLFSEATQSSDASFAPYLNLGFLDLELGNSQAATESFLAARNRCNSCLPSLVGLGFAYGSSGKLSESKETLENLLKKYPNNGQGLYLLASVLKRDKQEGSKEMAENHLKTLLAKDVGSPELRRRAQSLLRRMESETRLVSHD